MLRERFEREAEYLWQRLQLLTKRYPRLEALYARGADPRVARLVQSAAVAFAAVHARIHDDGQTLVRPLVAAAMPESLRPRPASTILKLSRSPSAKARFLGKVGSVDIPFELMWPARVDSLELQSVRIDRIHAKLQVLRLSIVALPNVQLGTVLPAKLRLFVRLASCARAIDLVHALRMSTNVAQAVAFDDKGARGLELELRPMSVHWVRVDAPEAPLLDAPVDRFGSSTELRDLYAFPESFCFFDLDVTPLRGGRFGRLELTLPLARVVDGIATLGKEHVHLGCAPATNAYRGRIEALQAGGQATQWPLLVAGRPHAEVLHVRALAWLASHDAHTRQAILSWESPSSPHRFLADDVYFLLQQSHAIAEARTECRVSFASDAGLERSLPGVVVEGEVVASDGVLADGLGLAEVGRAQGAENITRVAPSRRARLGENYPWRMNAYARMPPLRFVSPAYLSEFCRLHDTSDVRDEQSRIQVPRFSKASHRREHRLTGGMFEWGDVFDVDLAAPLATDGETWLIGELLSRAVSERNERLRFSRLSMSVASTPFATFSTRQGARFPFPIG